MDKNKLIAQFSDYLNHSDSEPPAPTDGMDLFRLFTELAALKSEVKRESKQVKDAFNQFRDIFTLLENNNKQLSAELERARSEQQQIVNKKLAEVLSPILDIRDRLVDSADATERYQPAWHAPFSAQHKHWIKQSAQGQAMTLRRLDQLLSEQQVQAISVLDKPLDPHCMQAVETAQNVQKATGIVLKEHRKGFTFRGQVLRTAEVVVNKKDNII